MTTQEALQLIDNTLANFSGTRADHAKIQEAIMVIGQALTPNAKNVATVRDPETTKAES